MAASLAVPNVEVSVTGRTVTIVVDQPSLLADAAGVRAALGAAEGQVGLIAAAAAAAGVRVDLRQKGGKPRAPRDQRPQMGALSRVPGDAQA